MKKWGLLLLLSIALVGCSEEKTSKQETKPAAEEKQETKVEVTDSVFYKWNDKSVGGMESITFYAKIKNTGDTVVDVMDSKLTYLNSNGSVIGTLNGSDLFISIFPAVIAPGQSSYAAINIDGGEEFKDLKDVTLEVKPVEIGATIKDLKTDKVNVVKSDEWGGTVGVTGFIKNDTDIAAETVQLAAALYDKDNKFLGALLPGSDQSFTVPVKEQTSFDIGVPSFPSEQVKNVDHAEVTSTSVYYDGK